MAQTADSPSPRSDYLAAETTWRQRIEASLRGEESWLALTGLFWLRDGVQAAGSDPGLPITLPPQSSPARAGSFVVHEGQVSFTPAEGVAASVAGQSIDRMTLQPDTSEHPTRLEFGSLSMMVIQRGSRLGLRVWDHQSPRRSAFPGRLWYPLDPLWRISCTYVAYDPPRPLQIATILGDWEQELCPGEVVLHHAGRTVHLHVFSSDANGLFLAFADSTNGSETYAAGRYLRSLPPIDGRVELDFNRATNPPCAFTPFATCSLPPEGNLLPFAVNAGERFVPHADRD
jgi:hypothetical protein